MSEYDREYVKLATRQSQIRVGTTVEGGNVTKFVRQLEYRAGDGVLEVVRYDHDPEAPGGHDVTEEGLHMDVYRDGENSRRERIGPPEPANRALTRAEEHLGKNLERFIRRFEEWHDLNPNRNPNSNP